MYMGLTVAIKIEMHVELVHAWELIICTCMHVISYIYKTMIDDKRNVCIWA